MSVLLAHHLEAQHLPVLVCIFAAGFFVGWQAVSRLLKRNRTAVG
jgi:divalent metal cation (Fe/Co/Zn/Cd) transporter